MDDFIVCAKCNKSNRGDAKFCSVCGEPLATNDFVETAGLPARDGQATVVSSSAPTKPTQTRPLNTKTQPLPKLGKFEPRPRKAIFGDRFLGEDLIYSNEQQHGYSVVEIKTVGREQIEQCPNDSCGAIYVPGEDGVEKFCIRCGTLLSNEVPALILFEGPEPIIDDVNEIARSDLVHESIRMPVAAFQEAVAGETRYCLVAPYVEQLPSSPERHQVMTWGETLALGLEYLHHGGFSFDGQIHEDTFGITNGKAVFSDFLVCKSQLEGMESARVADIHALATQLFEWLTGQSQYDFDLNLPPAIQQLFEQALTPPGFSTAGALAQRWQEALAEAAPPQTVEHRLGQSTDVGVARILNEDSLFTLQFSKYLESVPVPLGIYVVADGMGGHAAGEVASGAIVNTIAQKTFDESMASVGQVSPGKRRKWIESVIQDANKVVFDMGRKTGSDMGSTVVMAVLDGHDVHIGHVGDSRAYLIDEQGIEALTTDHSLVERLIATNQITREEARLHPQRNVIYRTLGDKPDLEVDTATHTLNAGDRLLLCSDGLNGMVEDEIIRQIVMEQSSSPQDACNRLIEAANTAGGDDNVSVVLVELTDCQE
jgi:PPM family protein phosphatase